MQLGLRFGRLKQRRLIIRPEMAVNLVLVFVTAVAVGADLWRGLLEMAELFTTHGTSAEFPLEVWDFDLAGVVVHRPIPCCKPLLLPKRWYRNRESDAN